MVLEPNSILGIEQTSLHSKEDSYMHSTDSQCPWLTSDLDSTTSCSRHGSLLYQDPQAQAICASPYQICANRGFP